MKHLSLSKKRIVLIGLILVLVAVYLVQTSRSQTSNIIVNAQTGTVVSAVPQTSKPQVGQTLTVNLTITNVQNLYALDVTLEWNSSILQVQSVNDRLGVEYYPEGVLHTASGYPIKVAVNDTSQSIGKYHIVATSQGDAASFNGSGTIAIITFNVTSIGHSGLNLKTELADHPSSGETSNPIDHTDVAGSVDSVIPEFPSIITIVLILALTTVALAFSKKLLKKNLVKQKRLTQESQLFFGTHRA